MIDLIKYINFRLEGNREQFDATSELLEYLYFVYIKHPFKRLWCSEEYRIARDLMKLKDALNTKKPGNVRFQTDFVKGLMKEYKIKQPLKREDKQTIENNILHEHRYYTTAAFIADIVNREERKRSWKWVVTTIIAVFAVIAYYGWFSK